MDTHILQVLAIVAGQIISLWILFKKKRDRRTDTIELKITELEKGEQEIKDNYIQRFTDMKEDYTKQFNDTNIHITEKTAGIIDLVNEVKVEVEKQVAFCRVVQDYKKQTKRR